MYFFVFISKFKPKAKLFMHITKIETHLYCAF